MPKFLRKIVRMFAIQWSTTLQYRGDIIIWTVIEAVTPLVALAIWFTVTSQNETTLQPRDTLTYYILTMLVIVATSSWLSFYLIQEILDGSIVRFLIRPMSAFLNYITNNIVEKIFKLALPIPIALAIFWIFPEWFSSSIYDPSRIATALVSIILGAGIAFTADAVLSTLAFWIEDAHQITSFHYLLWSLASGVLIPYAFLPEGIRTTLSFLPYRYIVSAPIEILLGSSATLSASSLIGIQIVWLCGLTLALRVLWQRGLKRYAIPGQ